jgi:hypothetical protein
MNQFVLALATVVSLGLTIPAFAEDAKMPMEKMGKPHMMGKLVLAVVQAPEANTSVAVRTLVTPEINQLQNRQTQPLRHRNRPRTEVPLSTSIPAN